MKPLNLRLAMGTGLVAVTLACWATSPPGLETYVKVETDSLAANPGNFWARAILFSDTLADPPSGFAKRLGNGKCRPMKLKTLGTAWVPNELVRNFQQLKVGETYLFAGTVNQTSRRFFVIVDACCSLQTSKDGGELWIDVLHPGEMTSSKEMAVSESMKSEVVPLAASGKTEDAEAKAREEAAVQEATEKPDAKAAPMAQAEETRSKVKMARPRTADEMKKAAETGEPPEWMQPIQF